MSRACIVLLQVAIVLVASNAVADEPDFRIQPLASIPPGTRVAESTDLSRWNRLVLLATPTINRGDTDALSDIIRDAVAKCELTIMATVAETRPTAADAGPAIDSTELSFSLGEVGIGYSRVIVRNGPGSSKQLERIILSSDSASQLGFDLGIIERQILSKNEEQTGQVRRIAKTSELVLFDAPSVMLIGNQHRKATTRHLLWISGKTGRGAMMVWLIEGEDANRKVVEVPIRVVPFGTRETRNVHVEGEEFNFVGIPSDMAFALESLPPGRPVPWTDATREVASLPRYTTVQLNELTRELTRAMSVTKPASN